MKAGKVLLWILLALVAGVVIIGGCVYRGYSHAVTLDEAVNNGWAQIENQLQRRYDLIPNLVETVKGVAGQEQKVFLGIAESRQAYFQANTVAEKAKAAGTLESALSRLLVLRETYPELKSNESFLKLQDSLEGTENRLSVERKRYNDLVTELNVFIRKPLGQFYAGLAKVEPGEYFEIEDAARTAPKVNFSEAPPAQEGG